MNKVECLLPPAEKFGAEKSLKTIFFSKWIFAGSKGILLI
jgi:hypothetical protein